MSPPVRSKRPTIPDVAREAGVGQGTAARVLGGYGAFSEEAAAKVTAAALRLGYSANGVARSMIKGRTNTIGVVVADIENPFFARATRGVTDAAHGAGFCVLLANSDEDYDIERTMVKVFMETRVDGLIVAPAHPKFAEHLVAAQQAGIAVVLLDRVLAHTSMDSVVTDNRRAGRDATDHLFAAGHRRIAVVTSAPNPEGPRPTTSSHKPGDISTSVDRVAGYLQVMRRQKPSLPTIVVGSVHDRETARQAVAELLRTPDRPTAVFTTDNAVALGAYDAVTEVGLRIPDDISIVAFDDAEWTSLVRPQITVVSQPVYQLGAEAAAMLLQRMEGREGDPVRRTLKASLIGRQSVAPPPRTYVR
jgi:LacI family transcriptional regulator